MRNGWNLAEVLYAAQIYLGNRIIFGILYSVHFLHASGKYNLDNFWHWMTSTLESLCLSISMLHSMLGHFVPLTVQQPTRNGIRGRFIQCTMPSKYETKTETYFHTAEMFE